MLYNGSVYTLGYYGELVLAFTFLLVDAETIASLEAEKTYVVISWRAQFNG